MFALVLCFVCPYYMLHCVVCLLVLVFVCFVLCLCFACIGVVVFVFILHVVLCCVLFALVFVCCVMCLCCVCISVVLFVLILHVALCCVFACLMLMFVAHRRLDLFSQRPSVLCLEFRLGKLMTQPKQSACWHER